MKQIIKHRSSQSKLYFSSLNIHLLHQGKFFLLLVISGVLFTGCFRHYYKVDSKTATDAAQIEQLKTEDKYFIFHCEDKVMGTANLNLVNDQLEADLVPLPKEHAHHTKPHVDDKNVMRSKQRSNTLMEVHLYPVTPIPSTQKHITVPLTSINRIDIYEMNATATRQNHILSTVGVTAAGILIAGTLIVLLTGGLVEP